MSTTEKQYTFHSDWFISRLEEWDRILPYIKARDRILEVGSFEGQSACWFLEHLLSDRGELYCIDTWRGSPELVEVFDPSILANSFETFKENIKLAKRAHQRVEILRGTSISGLAHLLMEQQGTFDLIFVDGAHDAASALTDCCMAWPLLKSGGVLVCDDYGWSLDADIRFTPKMAIDFFYMAFHPHVISLMMGYQFAVKKK